MISADEINGIYACLARLPPDVKADPAFIHGFVDTILDGICSRSTLNGTWNEQAASDESSFLMPLLEELGSTCTPEALLCLIETAAAYAQTQLGLNICVITPLTVFFSNN